jgi:hypothetical protein
MKYISILFVFLGFSIGVLSQNIRFSFQLGVALPQSDFAKSKNHPDNGGFAKTGFDMKLVGEQVYENNIVLGANLGYSVFGIDKDAIQQFFDPTNPESILVETQSFQNINLQARIGYDIVLLGEKMHITPFIDGGIGVFNSAYYFVKDANDDTFLRSGNTGLSFLVSPGLDVMYSINNFLSLKVYANYQMSNYTVEESFKVVINNVINSTTREIDYNYRNLSTGLGLTVIF